MKAVPAPAPTEQKSGVTTDFLSQGMTRVLYLGGAAPGDVDEVTKHTAYAAALYLYVAIRYRAETVAEPPLMVVEETEEGDEWVRDHALFQAMPEPSPDYDWGELIEDTLTWWDIHGDALWVKDQAVGGRIGRLTPFPGSEYEVKQVADRIRGRFEVRVKGGGMKPLAPEDVVYFRYPNPGSRQRGLSPTDVALSWMNLGVRTKATIKGLLQNAIFPSVVITTHADWHPTDDELQRFQDLVEQYHAGPANAGKPFVALGGGKVERVAFTLQELLPTELLDRVEATVASAFRIPPIVLGHLVGLKNSPWSQMEQAHRQAYQDAIEPLWRRIEKAATRQLLRDFEADPHRRLKFDTSAVRALREDESKKVADAAAAKHWTINQRLVHTGQEPLPDGDPRGEWIEALAATLNTAAGFPGGGGSGLPTDDDGASERSAGGPPALKFAPHDPSWKWARFNLMTKAQEDGWFRETRLLLGQDRDAVLEVAESSEFAALYESALESVPKAGFVAALEKAWEPLASEEKAPPPPGPTDPEEVAALIAMLAKALDADRWEQGLAPLIEGTGRTALKEVAAEIGISFDLISPSLLNYTREEAAWLVTNVSKTTRDRIAAELRAGLAEGESIPDLAKRLRASEGFGKARAELIARTETTRVTNGAQRQGLADYQRDQAVRVEKSWLSARDGRVRPEHQAQDNGEWVGVDQSFDVTGLMEPSEPNCFPAGTLVQGSYVAGLRAKYAGEVVVVRTARGSELTVTPNHPILTPDGWVPAEGLHEGGHVLSYGVQAGVGVDACHHDGPAAIDDVFRALRQRYASLPWGVGAEDLHGDGRFTDGHVDIVGPDGRLLRDFEAHLAELRREGVFVPAALKEAAVRRTGTGDLPLNRIGVAPAALPGSRQLPLDGSATAGLDAPPLQPLRFGPAADLDVFRLEATGEERPAVSGLVAELLQRFPRTVAVDQITEIGHREFSGHVYDLQSVTGLNVAGGIVTSNCRCTLLYRIVDEPEEA